MNKQLQLLPVSLLLLLAACSAPAAAPTDVPKPAVAPQPTPAPTAAPLPTEAPKTDAVVTGNKVLRIRMPADLVNADPAFHPAGMDTVTAETVGEGLVTFKPGTWELQNVLAESITSSDDGLRITFKLKEGVQFHGGYGELTAEDVKFSYERFLDEKLKSPYKGDWEQLDKVEVTGKFTGVIVLKKPFAPLWASTLPVTGGVIISKKALEKIGQDKIGTNPIGTGPYVFAEWKPKQVVLLKRNDAYWGEKPQWDEIRLIPIEDDSAAEVALEAGDIDFSTITAAGLPRFEANKKYSVNKVNTINYSGIFVNQEHPKLKDLNVREALRVAIDIDAINTAVHEGKLPRQCAIVGPGQIGYWQDAPCYTRDLAKAKAYLKAANLESLDLKLTFENNDTNKATAEVIQASLKEAGITIELDPVDGGAYWDGGSGDKGKERQLVLFDWGTTNPDPHWQMVWFSCAQIGSYNWMFWCDKAFDTLNTDAATTLDTGKRAALYLEAQQLWDKTANVIWTLRPVNFYAATGGIAPVQNPNGLVIPRAFTTR